MTEPTDLMVSAFYITPGAGNMYRKSVAIGISSALAVAPTVDGWVWCGSWDGVANDGLLAIRREYHAAPYLHQNICPGPHAKLIKVFKSREDTP